MGLDQMGTMFARREGTDPSLDPVYVGSHLDTQPTGGRYDGVLGVLSGLELVRTLNDLGIKTRRPIVVVNWTNEEGARFAPAMLASGVFAGIHALVTGTRSVAEIAVDCGFYDQSSFGKQFRKRTGMTPVEYRRAYAGASASGGRPPLP